MVIDLSPVSSKQRDVTVTACQSKICVLDIDHPGIDQTHSIPFYLG